VILWQGKGLTFGTVRGPGSGFFPTVLAVLLMALSVFLIIPRPKEEKRKPFITPSVRLALVVFVALVVFSFILEQTGFLISNFLLMGVLFGSSAPRKWPRAVLYSILCTGASYLLFEVILKSNLPPGLIGF
jgi:hypothetical protein